MPYVVERLVGGKRKCLTVGKGIYTQFLLSDCGPIGRPRSETQKGVSTSAVRLVLAALASRCRKVDLLCWPSLRTIAKDTGYATNTVMEALSAASDQGWVKIETLPKWRMERSCGRARPHQYTLLLPKLDQSKARKIIRGYVRVHWDTRMSASDNQRLTQFDNALSDPVIRREGATSH
jgi:hypothetical protein